MSDGHVQGEDLICGLHGWDYRLDTGVSAYENKEVLQRFACWVEGDDVLRRQQGRVGDVVGMLQRGANVHAVPFSQAVRAVSWLYCRVSKPVWETERRNRREGRGDDDRPLHTTHGAVDMA